MAQLVRNYSIENINVGVRLKGEFHFSHVVPAAPIHLCCWQQAGVSGSARFSLGVRIKGVSDNGGKHAIMVVHGEVWTFIDVQCKIMVTQRSTESTRYVPYHTHQDVV
jgi:hypothetical protein